MRITSCLAGLSVMLCLATAAQAQPRGGIVLYEDINFRGDSRAVDRAVRDLRELGFNDRTSSIHVESGTWQLCEDADFRGRCITISSDDRTLVPEDFNDRISSARMIAPGGGDGGGQDRRGDRSDNRRGGIELFADARYRGDSRMVSDDMRDLQGMGFNDVVSSFRIRSGRWEVCEDADFRGHCMTFDRDVESLEDYRLNDRISSVRRVR